MAKNIFQDMVKINSSRKSDLVKKSVRKPVLKTYEEEVPRTAAPRERVFQDDDVRPPKKRSLWWVAGFAVVFFIFSLSYFFARAEVTIDPKVKDFTVNLNMSAEADGSAEILPFDLIVISGDVSKTVVATLEKEVSESATGTVVIYNNFSTATQKLDIDTRLEGSNGKMYKTKKALIVPGMTGTTPGSVEVQVYAAEPGPAGNSEPLDFKIFGFKGGPKYEKFYGRSKGSLTGGFKGLTKVATDSDTTKARQDLELLLKKELLRKAIDQIPAGFVLLEDAVTLEINQDVKNTPASGDNLELTLSGTLHGVLFEENKLAKKIAEKVVSDFDSSNIYIANIDDLKFNFTGGTTLLSNPKKVDFSLSGQAQVVWRLDESKLTRELLGKSKSDFNQILLGYPNVVSANLSLSPIWNRTIPSKAQDIKIIVNYPVDSAE